MTAPYNIARWFSYSVTIAPCSSYGSRGSPVYGTGASVACHIEQSKENSLGPDGNELAANVTIYVSPDAVVNPYDRVTLPDGTVRPVRSVDVINTPTGKAALKVVRT